jgi:hypothetical protein
MEANITDEPFRGSDSSPSEPHFEDEATLLSARPVVPIAALTSKERFSRPWIFGIAVAGAILLGMAATVFYYSQFRAIEERSVAGIDIVSSGVQGVASEPLNLNELHQAKTTESDDSFADSNKSAKEKPQTPSRLATARPLNAYNVGSKKPAFRRETPGVDERSYSEYETRDERRAARRESKERKRERRAAKHSDEVLRIRDIFEGPARP